jgi:hypothetical protein
LELRHRDRVVQLKIVYYGPAVGGKTTNLQVLHAAAAERHRGEFISISSLQDRTILFDLLPLRGVGFHGFEIRFQLVAVPGQAAYASTRQLVMRGADAVVFVANSAADRVEENVTSLREMTTNLVENELDPASMPIVFQYNKRDLPQVASVEELTRALNFRGGPWREAVAIRGDGVLETLGAVIDQTMRQLTARFPALSLGPGESTDTWTWSALQQVFGRPTLAGRVIPPTSEAGDLLDQRPVRVAVPRFGEGPAAKGLNDKVLADSYAQASLDLGDALERMREDRDDARRRLRDVQRALEAIQGLEAGKPAADGLQSILSLILDAVGCRRGSLIAPGADRKVQVIAAQDLPAEPFLAHADTLALARGLFIPLQQPTLVNPAQEPKVAEVLARMDPPVKGLGVVPVRSGLGAHGLVMMYFAPTDPLPPPPLLTHLGLLARALASWFVLRRGLSLTSSAAATVRALHEIEAVVDAASQLVRTANRQPERAGGFLEQAAGALDGVAKLARSLGRD